MHQQPRVRVAQQRAVQVKGRLGPHMILILMSKCSSYSRVVGFVCLIDRQRTSTAAPQEPAKPRG